MLIWVLLLAAGTTVFAELISCCERASGDITELCSELIEGRSVLDDPSLSSFGEVVEAGSVVDEGVLLGWVFSEEIPGAWDEADIFPSFARRLLRIWT